jgi:hypothetical protein
MIFMQNRRGQNVIEVRSISAVVCLIIHQVEAVREDTQGECSVDSTIPSVVYEINK